MHAHIKYAAGVYALCAAGCSDAFAPKSPVTGTGTFSQRAAAAGAMAPCAQHLVATLSQEKPAEVMAHVDAVMYGKDKHALAPASTHDAGSGTGPAHLDPAKMSRRHASGAGDSAPVHHVMARAHEIATVSSSPVVVTDTAEAQDDAAAVMARVSEMMASEGGVESVESIGKRQRVSQGLSTLTNAIKSDTKMLLKETVTLFRPAPAQFPLGEHIRTPRIFLHAR
jgi:hypothetical protein